MCAAADPTMNSQLIDTESISHKLARVPDFNFFVPRTFNILFGDPLPARNLGHVDSVRVSWTFVPIGSEVRIKRAPLTLTFEMKYWQVR